MTCILKTDANLDISCKDFDFSPYGLKKVYVLEEDGVIKVYRPDGLELGEFIGYGEWTDSGLKITPSK